MTKKKPQEQLKKTGRKPKYTEAEAMAAKIDDYFRFCPDTVELVEFDKKNGEFVTFKKITPSICGLALFLGFNDRQSLYDYEKKAEFSGTIKKARTLVERHYELQLNTPNCTGAIFALKNMGWRDKQETEISTSESTQEAFLKHLKDLNKSAD